MDSYDNRPIGVFDSGLGGLTVVTNMKDILPNERFVYFGDTARTPYGSKSIETIKTFTAQITDFLIDNNVKMIVIACNTVSATCIDFIRKRHPDTPVVGMITPTAHRIASESGRNKCIGIIGTKVTIESKQYEKEIYKYNRDFKVYTKACPLFVPTIEEGIEEPEVLKPVIKYYLNDFVKECNLDNLVLGCTHYPLLEKEIKELYPDLEIINPSEIVAEEVKKFLYEYNMLALENNCTSKFYASDLSEKFINMVDLIITNRNITVEYKNF